MNVKSSLETNFILTQTNARWRQEVLAGNERTGGRRYYPYFGGVEVNMHFELTLLCAIPEKVDVGIMII